MTTNNFSTNSNENLSMNDQLYYSQIYGQFFDNDYIHCKKKIFPGSPKSKVEIECYTMWHIQCILFVRDDDFCKDYRDPWKEYQYFLWVKNETLPIPPKRVQSKYHFLCVIV